MLVLETELPGPILVQRLELYATHASQATGVFHQVEILLCETPVASLGTNFQANYGGGAPVRVFYADTLSIRWAENAPGWNGFDLEEPFPCTGNTNLIVEFRYLGHDGKTINARAASLPQADRCLSAGHPQSGSGTLMGFLTCMRLHYEGSSLPATTFGALKALFR